MPAQARLYRELQKDGLALVKVFIREDPATVRAFGEEFRLLFPLLVDEDGAVTTRYRVFRHPQTVVIDRDGKIRGRLVGERDWDSPVAREWIRSLLRAGDRV